MNGFGNSAKIIETAEFKIQKIRYEDACEQLNSALSEYEYQHVIGLFERIIDYADSKWKIKEARNCIAELEYKKVISELGKNKSRDALIQAKEKLQKIYDNNIHDATKKKIEEIDALLKKKKGIKLDDAPDSLVMLAGYISERPKVVTVAKRPF